MGIQRSINNILGSVAVATGAVGKVVKEQKEAAIKEEEDRRVAAEAKANEEQKI